MFLDSQTAEQYIVLWADSEALPDQIDVCSDVVTIDDSGTRCWRKQARQNRHCGGFTGAIMTKERGDLALIQVKI